MIEKRMLKKATYHLWTFTISKLISTFGAQIYAFAISFYILQTTGSATNFAINLICNILPRTIISPFAGLLADRFSRKKIIILSQIATTIVIGGLLFVTIQWGLSLVAIYTTTCILSLTSTFSGVTFTSSISGLVDKDRIQRAMALNQMSISLAAIGSPAVGGLLYGTVTIPVFLVMYMLASTLAVMLEATMNFNLFAKRTEQANKTKESLWASMVAGISYLKLQTVLLIVIWISLLVNFFFGAFEVGYSYILIDKLQFEPQHFGLTQGSFALGMIVMSIYFSVRQEVRFPLLVSKRGLLAMSVTMGFVSIPLLFSIPYYGLFVYYILLMYAFGSFIIIVNTPIQVMLQKQIDDDYKGRIFSILETMSMALLPIGMLLYGFLYDILQAEWVLITSSILLISIILILARPAVIQKAHPELKEKHLLQKANHNL